MLDRTANINDEFFIAICNRNEHSYISLGVNKANGEKELLGCFGKGFLQKYPKEFCSKAQFHLLGTFSHYDSILKSEKWSFTADGKREFNYKAYAITYQQYMQFLAYMRKVSLEQRTSTRNAGLRHMQAYAPITTDPEKEPLRFIESDKEGNINFSYQTLQSLPFDDEKNNLTQDYSKLSVGNTCRHTAMDLTKQVRQTPDFGSGVWSFFYKSFPLVASALNGSIRNPYFYILPLPPTAFTIDNPERLTLMNELYQRLDEMALIAPESGLTFQKFEGLKKLYKEIAGQPKEDIFAVIEAIEDWESENQELIKSHRLSHFFSFKTATEKMFIRFHEQFDRIKEDADLGPDVRNKDEVASI